VQRYLRAIAHHLGEQVDCVTKNERLGLIGEWYLDLIDELEQLGTEFLEQLVHEDGVLFVDCAKVCDRLKICLPGFAPLHEL
jgi:hypothetical protein